MSNRAARIEKAGTGHLYTALLSDPSHVDGARRMMAQWSPRTVTGRLGRVGCPVTFVVGRGDLTVPPELSRQVARRMARAEMIALDGGHLLHEEDPAGVARIVAAPD